MEVFSQVIIKLFLALVLGGLVGYEREYNSRPAGLRTHILVCLGATIVQITSINFYAQHAGAFNTDPMRMGAQVISGIGFLGAGTIIKQGTNIKGLTTAAGIWAVACIGLAIGSGLYTEGIITTVFMLISIKSLKKLEDRIIRDKRHVELCMVVQNTPGKLGEIGRALGELSVKIKRTDIHSEDEDNEYCKIELLLKTPCEISNEVIMDKLLLVGNIKEINQK